MIQRRLQSPLEALSLSILMHRAGTIIQKLFVLAMLLNVDLDPCPTLHWLKVSGTASYSLNEWMVTFLM